jgi:L-ribulokinase
MFAAVAAGAAEGGYASIEEAAKRMARLRDEAFEPTEANREPYDVLYGEYVRLHDLFGRGGDPAIKTLKRLRLEATAALSRA